MTALVCAVLAFVALRAIGWPWEALSPDVRAAHLARYEYAARAALEGRLPLWNPYEYSGLPLLATTTGMMLYPPIVVAHALLGPRAALEAVSLLHLLLIFLGTALYLRRCGIARPCTAFAGATALGPVLGAGGYHYPNLFASAAWVPLLLFLLDRGLEGPDWRWIGGFAFGSAMQWLAGYPEYPMDTAVLLVVLVGAGRRALGLRSWLALGVGIALGGAIAAVQLVPLAEMVRESDRGLIVAVAEPVRSAFGLGSLEEGARAIARRFGLPFLCLALAGASLRPDTRRGWLAACVWGTLALNFPLSLLYRLPPWSGSRAPIGWLGLSPLFLGFLAAAGLQRLLSRRSVGVRSLALLLAVGAIAHGPRAIADLKWRVEERPYLPELVAQRAERLRAMLVGPARGASILSWSERLEGGFLRHRLPSPTGYEPSRLEPRRVAGLLEAVGLRFGSRGPDT